MTDREKAKLKGTVRSLREDYFHADPATGELHDRPTSTEQKFNRDGRLETVIDIQRDGSRFTSLRVYDPNGRLTEVRYVETKNAICYEYDDRGRLLRQVGVAEGKPDEVSESYRYEPDGSFSRTHFVPTAIRSQKTSYGFQIPESEIGVFAPGAVSYTAIYSARGFPVETMIYGERHNLLMRFLFQCDEAGRILEERMETGSDLSDLLEGQKEIPPEAQAAFEKAVARFIGSQRVVHRYDENGRRIETRREGGMISSELRTRSFDEHGNVIREHSISEDREVGLDEAGTNFPAETSRRESTTEFRYRYDDRGNWVEQVQSTAGRVVLMKRRSIEYFESSRIGGKQSVLR